MRCRSCSTPVPEGNRFCGACGVPIAHDSDTPTRTLAAAGGGGGATPVSAGRGSSSDPHAGARFVPGTLLAGRYRIVSRIGMGGMGEVCRADDLKLGQVVALKFLPEGLEGDEGRLQRLLGEVRIARQISHANICRVYDIGEVDPPSGSGHAQHFISMEYVDGEDLSSLLRRIGRLPEDKAVQIARQMCAGLAAAHERGILHRDLKPANVMIDGRGQVRITDFGLAALAEDVGGRELCAGTPEYMAPEQLEGEEVSVRSDIYALGHVLYELFTGKPAFRGETLADLKRLQRETTPPSPGSLVPTLDPAVERVILHCLEKDPRQRPASALAVAAALPGGDPLAAALAAGETPSPEMVAAAGPEGGLRPAIGLACLAGVVVGAVLLGLLVGQTTLYGLVPLDRAPSVLEARAQELIRGFGYEEPAADRASDLVVHRPALEYFARRDSSASRWDPLTRPGQIALKFEYRQSREPMAPRNLAGRVYDDDPAPRPGDIHMTMGLEGRLLYFLARPPFVDHEPESSDEMDWSILFDAAGLDMADFEPTAPTIQPQAHSGVRKAWTGVLPHRGDLPVRVEASALRGKPVFFETVTPYDSYWSEEAADAAGTPRTLEAANVAMIVLLCLITLGALVLAMRNLRLGRGDRRGATRLAFYVLALRMLQWMFTGHHVPDFDGEFGLLVTALGGGLILAALTWVLYLSIEPYFRRLWPEALVSSTRLLAGRFRDPLVGRDLLLGFTFGIGLQLLVQATYLAPSGLGLPPPPPLSFAIDALAGDRWAFGELFAVQLRSLPPPLGYIVLFLLLRIVLRKERVAAVAFCALCAGLGALSFAPAGGGSYSAGLAALGALTGTLQGVVLILLMVRFGVLSMVGCFLMFHLFAAFPLTFDVSAPYFATSVLAMLAAVALSAYAFHTSLAGRPLLHDALLAEQPRRTV